MVPHNKTTKTKAHAHEHAMAMIRKEEKLVTHLASLATIYAYGGGRVNGRIVEPVANERWTDCSGCAIYVVEHGLGIKLKNGAGSTWSLVEEGEHGLSQYFTLLVKNDAGDEHVIARARKRPRPWHFGQPRFRYWECGGSDNPKVKGGPSWFIPGIKMGLTWKKRVAEFYEPRNFDRELGLTP